MFRDQVEAFEALFVRWKEVYLDQPEQGLEIAKEAVCSAESLGKALAARSLALLGSAYKTLARFPEAEAAFMQALNLLEEETGPEERVDILRRLIYLRVEQFRFDEALALAEEAEELAAGLSVHCRATVRMAKGFAYGGMGSHRDALFTFCAALDDIDYAEDPGVGHIALHNIIVAISLDEKADKTALEQVLKQLDRVRRQIPKMGDVFRLKLKWAEALVDLRFGINNRALATLKTLRREFRRRSRPSLEFAMISIDLAQAYIQTGDPDKALAQLQTAHDEFGELEGIHHSVCDEITASIEALKQRCFEIGMLYVARRAFLQRRTTGRLQTVQYSQD